MDCMRDHFSEGVVLDGRFETVSPLNHGSFGLVFLAKDRLSGDLVAVKCTPKPSAMGYADADVNVDERSEELSCHQVLGVHPNIVNMLHTFETDAHRYLVLEYCSMGDLYEAIRLDRGPLETEHVRSFMLELVDAVEYMHSKGFYHRDIKPENIFLAQSGSMKLGDFGLATRDTWSTEAAVGSDRYMAPEQYDSAGNGYAPAKADIWAVGICLLNVLFGRNPFATPTESDILFSDYVRDRQSLFDIFPNMSLDTFEILTHALTVDPEKRSLQGVREGLQRAISFTTDDESLDDFCTETRDVVPASANREPLRTPSIQSPQLDQGGSFPWAKALQMSPAQPVRRLSAILDTEDSTEEMFPGYANNAGWYSAAQENASLASALDSGLGASIKSMTLRAPPVRDPPRADPPQVSGSVPITVSRPIPAMASVFGKKDEMVSKSWSDLWDEEIEEQAELEHQNFDDERTIRSGGLREIKDASQLNSRTSSPKALRTSGLSNIGYDGISENDGFFFEDHPSPKAPRNSPPRSKREIMDKWTALGARRRAHTNGKTGSPDSSLKRPLQQHNHNTGSFNHSFNNENWRRGIGFGATGFQGESLDRKNWSLTKDWRREQPQQAHHHNNNNHNHHYAHFHNPHSYQHHYPNSSLAAHRAGRQAPLNTEKAKSLF
ncbi:serine/threonine protein kinase [Xylona heveae TC161]|uniref:Autophagy-related protein 1 n=1 Tax=Xylona heveae (strain CBS 132557 / TC161) TaxID=1328760 RepID=A0A165GSC1_XYLHT|nr:serine/threonine protein kinase [Xylona heveae TC161]KZF22533.1 serine/threonine protein kinase [Xylona heveae TC161]